MSAEQNFKGSDPAAAIAYLRKPNTIRAHCLQICQMVRAGESKHFNYHHEVLEDVADFIVETTKAQYPDLKVPLHSRLRHFANNVSLENEITAPDEGARITCITELIILSVFLDAGAGSHWRFIDSKTDTTYTRSEGLAIAILRAYQSGIFSERGKDDPLRVDAHKLRQFTEDELKQIFQVSEDHPLEGIDGRLNILREIGRTLSTSGSFPGRRLGDFMPVLQNNTRKDGSISAYVILQQILSSFPTVWNSAITIGNTPLGDVAYHYWVKGAFGTDGLVPFHKLAQWLCFSLVDLLQQIGVQVDGENELTALAEYRNGGLLIDTGLLTPIDSAALIEVHEQRSEIITEWRALTISLLDELAIMVRKRLNLDDQRLSLGRFLQGGTWAAGRELAFRLRHDGASPLKIASDGSLF